MFVHVVDFFLNFVQIYNATTLPVTIPKRTRLNSIVEYNQKKCYFADPNDAKLTFTGWKNKIVKIVKAAVIAAIFLISFSQPETVFMSLRQLPTVPMASI